MALPWKVWHQVLSYFSDVRDLCRLEQVSRSFLGDIRHFRWAQMNCIEITVQDPFPADHGSVKVMVNGKEFPKRFPLETCKLVIKCLMERSWKLKELTFRSTSDDDLIESQILPLLSLSVSRFLSNLELGLALRTPSAQVPQLISKFTTSLTILTIRERIDFYEDNVNDAFLILATAIGSCHKLESLNLYFANPVPEHAFDLSSDAFEQGLSIMLQLMKLKNMYLALGLNFDPDGSNYSSESDLVNTFSLAFSRALLSSPAKFESLQLYIPNLMPKFLGCYWKIAKQRTQQSDHPLVNLRSLRCERDFMEGGDLSLLLKICPNLRSFCSDSTYHEIRSYAIAYLREHAMGDKEKELNIGVFDLSGDSHGRKAARLIDEVPAEVVCDVVERQDLNKIHFRKRNAVLNVQM